LELEKNKWIGSDGKEVFVPVGDWTSEYHSHCYRLKNISNEVKDHKWF